MLAACATKPPPPPPPPPAPPPPAPVVPKVEAEESLRSTPAGVDLALRRRVLTPVPAEARNKVVLLLPPVGIPSAAAFDVKDYSLMDFLAGRGFDAWAVDYRGFGRSSSAPVVIGPNRQPAPTPRLEHTLADVKEAIDTVLASTKARDLTLIGYGYGGVVAALAAERYPEKVSRLVLYNTAFSFKLGKLGSQLRQRAVESKPGIINTQLPAYQEIDWENGPLKEWQTMMGGRPLADQAAIEAVATAFYATDYLTESGGKRRVRRPTGPLLDMYRIWSARPAFDPVKIKVPTLVLRGELDPLAEPNLSKRLKGTKIVREVVIKNATHWMLYEKSRSQLLEETGNFLSGN
jgi:pimeloyl-ACP methyl ester carboxylesterase